MADATPPPAPMEPVPWPAGFDDPGWRWQLKWDGVRCIAECGRPRLWSRRGLERTARYPEIAAELRDAVAGRSALLDGEIVALGEAGRPSFPLVMRRAMRPQPSPALLARIPVIYAVFDALVWDGEDLRPRPVEERLACLDRLAATAHIHTVETRTAGGIGLVAAAAAAGLEGAVAKRAGSPYVSGRSPLWRKVKPRRTLRAGVVGYQADAAGRLRSLALAAPVDGAPAYVGNVGSGLTEDLRSRLSRDFARLPPWPPPFPVPRDRPGAPYRWVGPVLAATVTYAEWTPEGRLRSPVLAGLSAGAPVGGEAGAPTADA